MACVMMSMLALQKVKNYRIQTWDVKFVALPAEQKPLTVNGCLSLHPCLLHTHVNE